MIYSNTGLSFWLVFVMYCCDISCYIRDQNKMIDFLLNMWYLPPIFRNDFNCFDATCENQGMHKVTTDGYWNKLFCSWVNYSKKMSSLGSQNLTSRHRVNSCSLICHWRKDTEKS